MKTSDIQVVRAAIVDPEHHVLLLERAPDETCRPGDADLPGGGVELGESLAAAVVREVWEETGLELPETAFQRLQDGASRGKHRTLFGAFLGAADVEVRVNPAEHSGHIWVPSNEVEDYFPHREWGFWTAEHLPGFLGNVAML